MISIFASIFFPSIQIVLHEHLINRLTFFDFIFSGRLCGDFEDLTYTSTGNSMFVKFVTNGDFRVGAGFTADYIAVDSSRSLSSKFLYFVSKSPQL